MTSLKGDLRSIMGTPFGGVGHAVLIFSRVTRAAFNSDSVVLQLHDRIEMPEEADGKFQVDGLDPGPIRIELEGGTVHNHGWNIDLPDEGVWSLTDLVDAQVDWSPAVIGRAEAAAREAMNHADRAEAGADRVGTAEQVGVWASEASASASDASSARYGALTARNAAQSASEEAEGYASSAATSESNAATSETNAKQSETNAGDYAAVATTAATEAVDAMERATDLAGGDFATHEYVDASNWSKAPLSGTDNIDELTPGLYPVRNGATATALGLPEGTIGSIEHIVLDPSSLYRRQYYRADPTNGAAVEYRRTYYNGTWNAWEKLSSGGGDTVSYYRGAVPDGITPEEMTGANYQGLWTYSSANAAGWSIPSSAAGMIEVAVSGLSTLHQVSTLTTPIRNFQRRWYNGSWSGPWETLGGGSTPAPEPEQPPVVVEVDEYATDTSKSAINLLMPSVVDPTLSYEDDHAALVADLKSRLGTVDTGGKAAVALVADHGTTAFKDWLWAEAKSRDIPFTMALAPEVHLDGKGDSRHTATNEDIKQWISEGLVIASHSGDHGGALGYFDVSRQIKTSKAKLEEKLETTVDCWVQPGYTLALGNYDGFGTGQSESRYTDYYAGRMLQQTYAVVTGYAGSDFVYPGDADLPVGVRRSLTERKDNQAGVIANIEQAITTGGKHINFCHPYALPDSSTTYVTKSEYIAYLDWLAQKRDAGDLVLLTLPQLAVAR